MTSTSKPTARKSTTGKRASGKATAGKAAAGKAATGKTAARRNPADRVLREKQHLLTVLEESGLLTDDAVESLEKKVESIKASTLGDSLGKSASWDRSLVNCLQGFRASGGDGKPAESHQALVLWQKQLACLEPTPEGLHQAMEALKRVIPYGGATLYLRNTEKGTVSPLFSCGFPVDLISRIRFEEGSGFSAWVASRRKPVLYSSLHRNEAPRPEQIRSFMAAPLLVGGECVGVMTMGHAKEGSYQPSTLRVLILAASMFSALVQRHLAIAAVAAREIRHPVTGLATQAYLASRLEEEVLRCRELGYSMSLVRCRFNELEGLVKRFGDEYRTRVQGDIAEVMAEWKLPTELAGHGPGDDLVVLVPGANREKSAARAEALRELLEKHSFPRRKRMTLQLGVACYPSDAEDAQEMLNVADNAMCEAESASESREESYPAIVAQQ